MTPSRPIIALALAGSLLAACSTVSGTNARITAGKAIADAWAVLDGASQAADAAVHSGLLKGARAATVSQDLKLAQASLTAATTAYQANQSTNVAAEVTAATTAAAAVLTIVAQAQGETH